MVWPGVVAIDMRSSQQATAKDSTVTETGKKPFIGARRKWLDRCAKGRGRNSVLMRGTPKNRFSLAEMRARTDCVGPEGEGVGGLGHHDAKRDKASDKRGLVPGGVRKPRTKRSRPWVPGGQGARFGPVMRPERKVSSIQPQIASADRKAVKAPCADVSAAVPWAATTPASRTGSVRRQDQMCWSPPALSGLPHAQQDQARREPPQDQRRKGCDPGVFHRA